MKINILIVNWCSAKTVRDCIQAILLSDEREFRIFIINNFSSIDDLKEIKSVYNYYSEFTDIELLENNANFGYAKGNNVGLRFIEDNQIEGDILILNPDVRITENTISELKRNLTKGIGIVTPRTRNANGVILYDAMKLYGFLQLIIITNNKFIDTQYSQGSCLLINRETMRQVGVFDERFFLYWEEVDFSLRVKNAGKRLVAVTTTHVLRNSNCLSRQPLSFYYSLRNAKLLRSKHGENFSFVAYWIYVFYIFVLLMKYVSTPKLFAECFLNCCYGLMDSWRGKYYSRNL